MKKLAFLILLAAFPSMAATAHTQYEDMKVRHQEERRSLMLTQKQSKKSIRRQAAYMNESERGNFIKNEFQKLEEEKKNLMKQQAREREEFFIKNPEMKSKSERGALKESQRKKAALQKTQQPAKP